MSKNFTNLKETNIKIQVAQRAPHMLNPNRPTLTHIIIKMAKVKEWILKATREKQNVNYKGTPIRLSSDFSQKQNRPEGSGNHIFNVPKGKKLQPGVLYPAKISFKIEGEIKNFSNKQKLNECSNIKTILKEILKKVVRRNRMERTTIGE